MAVVVTAKQDKTQNSKKCPPFTTHPTQSSKRAQSQHLLPQSDQAYLALLGVAVEQNCEHQQQRKVKKRGKMEDGGVESSSQFRHSTVSSGPPKMGFLRGAACQHSTHMNMTY